MSFAPWEKPPFVLPEPDLLLKAVKSNNLDEVHSLISQGVDPNKDCIIAEAAALGRYEIVRFLIDNGADVNCNRYSYPILQAVRSKDIRILKLLLEHGADLTVRNNQLATVLIEAARLNNFEAVKFLVGLGVDINARDRQGRTAVYYSATSSPLDPIDFHSTKFLLEHGAILDRLNQDQFRKLIREGTRNSDPEISNFFVDFVKKARNREYNRVLIRGSAANPDEPSLANLPNELLELISRKAADVSFGTSEIRYLRKLIN